MIPQLTKDRARYKVDVGGDEYTVDVEWVWDEDKYTGRVYRYADLCEVYDWAGQAVEVPMMVREKIRNAVMEGEPIDY